MGQQQMLSGSCAFFRCYMCRRRRLLDVEGVARSPRCAKLWRKVRWLCSRRAMLRLGFLFLIVLALSASVMVVYSALQGGSTTSRPPSSCVTAQNATATCQMFEDVGWDAQTGDTAMSAADTIEACCAGCDRVNGCQGWMFESFSRRCRWLRFMEAPCVDNPGHPNCRCRTQPGTVFGFKPTSQIVWLPPDV